LFSRPFLFNHHSDEIQQKLQHPTLSVADIGLEASNKKGGILKKQINS